MPLARNVLTRDDRVRLAKCANSETGSVRVARRSGIVLFWDAGWSVSAISRRLRVSPTTVRLWCRRFAKSGITSLTKDARGRGRKPRIATVAIEDARDALGKPLGVRATARMLGISPSSVTRIRRRLGRDMKRTREQ